jgi:putative transposase
MANPYGGWEGFVKNGRRQSIRLKDFDYTVNAAYFVTLCTWEREASFGTVISSEMQPSSLGTVVQALWLEIPDHPPQVQLDSFILMPNHMHAILIFTRRGLPWQTLAPQRTPTFGHRVPGSLGSVIGTFKSAVTRQARETAANPELRVWQKNYFERVIRNDRELNAVREYIAQNPTNWARDRETKSDLEWHGLAFPRRAVLA